jgi:hypothetical protein
MARETRDMGMSELYSSVGCRGGFATPTKDSFLALPAPRRWQRQKRSILGDLAIIKLRAAKRNLT